MERPAKGNFDVLDFGFTSLKSLAMLIVAFEGEIDKLLPDHRGYVTQSVCWHFLEPWRRLPLDQITDLGFPRHWISPMPITPR